MASEQKPGGDVAITEDEAALYDRQIRLWGIEAQQKMRNATILVINLKGLATEVIKNIVLAGIGKLVLADDGKVTEEDLGAGFFFTDEDVGKSRTEAATPRIQSLNPLVVVETHQHANYLGDESLESVIKTVDLVCATDLGKDILIRIDGLCRQHRVKFYAGASYGMLGFIFCDLSTHEYVSTDRSSAPQVAAPPKTHKHTIDYPSFSEALEHSWKGLRKKETRELNPAAVFTLFSLLEWQRRHNGLLPDDPSASDELEEIANLLLGQRQVNKDTITAVPRSQIEILATTAAHEFSPVCAVVGGILAQDILRTLSAKDPPLANWFTFDGSTGGGTTCRLGVVGPNEISS